MSIANIEKRLESWDTFKEIALAFAELNLLHYFTTGMRINAVEALQNLTADQINRLLSVLTGEEKQYTPLEAMAVFQSFLLFWVVKMVASPELSGLLTAITANQNPQNTQNQGAGVNSGSTSASSTPTA